MGVVLRYILSDLSYNDAYSGEQTTAASAFSADISGYYVTYPMVGRNECQFAWGFNISNIGSKVSYNHGTNNAFLPTNLRLGANFMFPLADYNTLAFGLDLNKLLVPTKPRTKDYDMDTQEGQEEFEKALDDWENMSPITGILPPVLMRCRRRRRAGGYAMLSLYQISLMEAMHVFSNFSPQFCRIYLRIRMRPG